MPSPSRVNQSASVPFPTPTAYEDPQNSAKSFSNAATNGPPANAVLSITSRMTATNSSFRGSWWAFRSKNGTCISFVDRKHLQYPRRIANDHAVCRHILRDHTAGTNDRAFSHGYPAKKRRAGTD